MSDVSVFAAACADILLSLVPIIVPGVGISRGIPWINKRLSEPVNPAAQIEAVLFYGVLSISILSLSVIHYRRRQQFTADKRAAIVTAAVSADPCTHEKRTNKRPQLATGTVV